MASGRGGKREGAGRPKGSKNRMRALTDQQLDEMKSTGDLPHELLAKVYQDPDLDVETRIKAANMLMPYTTVKATDPEDGTTDEDIERRLDEVREEARRQPHEIVAAHKAALEAENDVKSD